MKKPMLKRTLCIIISALEVLSFCACGKTDGEPAGSPGPEDASAALPTAPSAPAQTSSVARTPEPVQSPSATQTPEPVQTPSATHTPEPLPTSSLEPLEAPVYNADELLSALGINRIVADFCCAIYPVDLSYILNIAPTEAQRKINQNKGYIFYETEEGYRLYIFYDSKFMSDEEPHCVGFPVYVKELHSFAEFANLKIGDTIDDVALIDPAACRIRDSGLGQSYYHSCIANNMPMASFHYLSNGVLKIEYDMNDEGVIYIINIVYSPNYRLMSTKGKSTKEYAVVYKIYPEDLPAQ